MYFPFQALEHLNNISKELYLEAIQVSLKLKTISITE